jgi:hypothetical protein
MAALGRKLFKQGIDHLKSKEFREYLMRYVRNELLYHEIGTLRGIPTCRNVLVSERWG